jgi:hypothetical protein
MAIKRIILLAIVSISMMLIAGHRQIAHAMPIKPVLEARDTALHQQTTPAPYQTANPTGQITPTPVDRELPPVGNNAILILGGSLLVLIIIGGVMISSRLKSKH